MTLLILRLMDNNGIIYFLHDINIKNNIGVYTKNRQPDKLSAELTGRMLLRWSIKFSKLIKNKGQTFF